MAYQALSLPPGIPKDVESIIRNQLEPQLIDAHAMLRLPIREDPGLQGGCNFAATQVLLSLVSGVSVTLYDPNALSRRGDRGKLFKDVLVNHYPWDQERNIAGAQLGANAAEQLYGLFRNPLAHTLGVIDPQDNPSGRRVIVEKGSIPENDIELTEKAVTRPSDWRNPTLREEGKNLILWVRSLYWGVRKMIEDVAHVRVQSKESLSYIIAHGNLTEWRST